MTKEQREELRLKIIAAIKEMTEDLDCRESVVSINGHTIARRLVYAGGSQWSGCGRDWDNVESAWAWVVDGLYHLTTPKMFGFDGHNTIEQQTPIYLMDGYDTHSTPVHDGRDPLTKAPGAVLIEIGKGIRDALHQAREEESASQRAAGELINALP